MRKLLLLTTVLCALAGLYGAALPASAPAAGLSPPVADCSAHAKLTRHYPPAELQNALKTMPADIAEYSDCKDVIQRALLAELGKVGAGSSAGGGGSFLPGWVVAILAVLLVAAAAAGALAVRNRRRAAGREP
jgi:hypothetical protein